MQIASWDDVDKGLLELGNVEREMARRKADRDQAVASADKHLAAALKPLEARRVLLLAEMEAFARAHEQEMTGRSKVLFHGRVYFRRVTVLTTRSWQRVLDWLLENKRMDYVRVKYEVNKEALESAPERTLQACAVRWRPKDKFGYELPGSLPK